MPALKQNSLDPLYIVFEQHLYTFKGTFEGTPESRIKSSNLNRHTFIDQVLQDYFSYLKKLNITVPKSLEELVYAELFHRVQTMLVKKAYGALTLQDFQKKISYGQKRKVKARYSRLLKQAG